MFVYHFVFGADIDEGDDDGDDMGKERWWECRIWTDHVIGDKPRCGACANRFKLPYSVRS